MNERAVGMYKDFGFEHQKVYDPDQGPYVQLRDRHGSIIYMMSLVPKDGQTLLSMETLKEVLDLDRLKRGPRRHGLQDEAMNESQEVLQYLPEEDLSVEEIIEREKQTLRRSTAVPRAESYSEPRDASFDVEKQKLDDLLASGFIFEEEYAHRLESLTGFYDIDKRKLAWVHL
jgi:hypothetical protein